MPSEIVLIGPLGVGKTTIGGLLAKHYGVPSVRLDRLSRQYFAELDFDRKKAESLRQAGDLLELYQYSKPFEAYAVERVLADHQDCVFDFGAGHVTQDGTLFEQVQRALEPYSNVVLLLPTADDAESIRILKQRERTSPRPRKLLEHDFDFVEHWVTHPANHDLAKLTIYTHRKTPAEVHDQIIAHLPNPKAPRIDGMLRRATGVFKATFGSVLRR